MKLFFVSLFILVMLFSNNVAFANIEDPPGGIEDPPVIEFPNPLSAENITELLKNILDAIRNYIAPPIVAGMILYGAFQILFAYGDPKKFETGKKTILYAVIGYVIILLASGISLVIKDILQ